jgi:glycosyltransferase involved in cell wall biosynthesis
MKRKISSGAEADFDASIVIATRDRSADLKVTLEHLARAEVPAGWPVELLIVDNGSSDDTKAVARAEALRRAPFARPARSTVVISAALRIPGSVTPKPRRRCEMLSGGLQRVARVRVAC